MQISSLFPHTWSILLRHRRVYSIFYAILHRFTPQATQCLRNPRTKMKNEKKYKKYSLGFAVNRLHSIYFVEDFFKLRTHIEMKIKLKKINLKIELKKIFLSFRFGDDWLMIDCHTTFSCLDLASIIKLNVKYAR